MKGLVEPRTDLLLHAHGINRFSHDVAQMLKWYQDTINSPRISVSFLVHFLWSLLTSLRGLMGAEAFFSVGFAGGFSFTAVAFFVVGFSGGFSFPVFRVFSFYDNNSPLHLFHHYYSLHDLHPIVPLHYHRHLHDLL